jgi:hypothetical protein
MGQAGTGLGSGDECGVVDDITDTAQAGSLLGHAAPVVTQTAIPLGSFAPGAPCTVSRAAHRLARHAAAVLAEAAAVARSGGNFGGLSLDGGRQLSVARPFRGGGGEP